MTKSFQEKPSEPLTTPAANPKGIESISRGLASLRAYPGIRGGDGLNPERVAANHRPQRAAIMATIPTKHWRAAILFALLLSTAAVRADLILEQQSGETNHFHLDSLKLHGDKMRLDQPDNSLSVIVDLKTRDSITLITTNKTYLRKFGSEVRWEMEEDLKYTHGTNEMDAPPARPVATGKSELVSGQAAEIYTWSGAHGLKETLWVATNFPNYDLIQAELAKVDHFNDTGPHRNAQPELSLLPGMVLKRSSTRKGHTMTTTLVSVKVGPVDAALFELPKDYSPWKPAEKKP